LVSYTYLQDFEFNVHLNLAFGYKAAPAVIATEVQVFRFLVVDADVALRRSEDSNGVRSNEQVWVVPLDPRRDRNAAISAFVQFHFYLPGAFQLFLNQSL
jgi:hypothetical protein